MSKLHRRDLLRAGGLIGAGAAMGLVTGCSKAQEASAPPQADDAPAGPPPGARPPAHPFAPKFSMAERDRRWANARALMESLGIEALVVPHNPLDRALPTLGYADYLSEALFMGPGAVLLPLNGEPMIFGAMMLPPMIPKWIENRGSDNDPLGRSIAATLTDQGLGSARIGVLGAQARVTGLNEFTQQGFMLATVWNELEAGLPNGELVDVTGPFGEMMLVKGEEEIAAIETAAAASERFHADLMAFIQPGTVQPQIQHFIANWFMENGASTAVEVLQMPFPPRPVGDGTVINTEYDVFVGGGRVQATLCLAYGEVSDETNAMAQTAEAALGVGLENARPGARFSDVVGAMETVISDAGYWNGFPCIHSLSPIMLVGQTRSAPPPYPADAYWGGDVVLQPGMVLSFEPNARSGPMDQVKVGGTGIITETGVRMLNTLGTSLQRL